MALVSHLPFLADHLASELVSSASVGEASVWLSVAPLALLLTLAWGARCRGALEPLSVAGDGGPAPAPADEPGGDARATPGAANEATERLLA